MGCRCCKGNKLQSKTFSEQQTQTDILPSETNFESKMNDSNNNNINNFNKEKENNNNENNNFKPDVKVKMPYEEILKDYLDEKIDGTEVFDKKWYSNLEKDKIIYSKRSIIAMINSAFDDKNEEYKEIYNKEPLVIAIKSTGSFLSDQFQVIRSVYTVNKNIYPPNTTIRMITKYLIYIKERSSWDTQLKLYKVIEGSEEGNEVKCLVQNWTKSPMFLVSERDIVEKRYDFYHEGKFLSFASSVNDDYYPIEKKVTRITDIIFIEELYEEDNNIILKALTQMDAKVSLPQAIVNATLSTKLLDFYNGLAKAMNKDYKEGKLVFEDNEGNIIENNNLNE